MNRKKIVLDSDSDDDSDEGAPKTSFISGAFNRSMKNFDKKLKDTLIKNLNTEYKAQQQKPLTVPKKGEKKKTKKKIPKKGVSSPDVEVIDLEEEISVCKKKTKPKKTAKAVEKEKEEEEEMEELICMSDGEETVIRVPKRQSLNKKSSPPKAVRVDKEVEVISLEDEVSLVKLSPENSLNKSMDESFTKDDDPINIKVKRLDEIKTVTILKNQPMSATFDEISEKFNIPVPNILLYFNDEMLDPKSTPKSLKITIADIIEILVRSSSTSEANTANSTANDPNFVMLHFRDNTKKKIILRVNRFQTVKNMAEQYAKEKGVSISSISFKFDSEEMELDKKIDYYEMENEDQIDVVYR